MTASSKGSIVPLVGRLVEKLGVAPAAKGKELPFRLASSGGPTVVTKGVVLVVVVVAVVVGVTVRLVPPPPQALSVTMPITPPKHVAIVNFVRSEQLITYPFG